MWQTKLNMMSHQCNDQLQIDYDNNSFTHPDVARTIGAVDSFPNAVITKTGLKSIWPLFVSAVIYNLDAFICSAFKFKLEWKIKQTFFSNWGGICVFAESCFE